MAKFAVVAGNLPVVEQRTLSESVAVMVRKRRRKRSLFFLVFFFSLFFFEKKEKRNSRSPFFPILSLSIYLPISRTKKHTQHR